MAGDLLARCDQSPWQATPQNQCDVSEAFDRTGSNQPKPCAGRRHTAHSWPRECQRRSRFEAGAAKGQRRHQAALPSSAPNTTALIATWFQAKLKWQLAAYLERPKSNALTG